MGVDCCVTVGREGDVGVGHVQWVSVGLKVIPFSCSCAVPGGVRSVFEDHVHADSSFLVFKGSGAGKEAKPIVSVDVLESFGAVELDGFVGAKYFDFKVDECFGNYRASKVPVVACR